MPFDELRKQLSVDVAEALALPDFGPKEVEAEFGTPPNPQMGHVALPCFKLSKRLRKDSNSIAKDLAEKLKSSGIEVVPAGPYANFKWNVSLLYRTIISRVMDQKADYGRAKEKKNEHVLIEYCSPNIAKKLGFQHIRSTLIGNVLANTYERMGFHVTRLNFVGDWGSQFAKLFAAVEKWGDREILSGPDRSKAIDHLFELYVKFHKEIDTDPSYADLASKALQKLESQESEAIKLWQTIKAVSIHNVDTTLSRLSVKFDQVEGESDYIPAMDATLKLIKEKANARLSEGAWIVEVPGLTTPALIQKKDGTTLYLTRDIAAALDRKAKYKFDRMIYVVSEQQKLHFQLLFGTLKLMGNPWADQLEHVSFGTVLFGAEKMSTREGRVVFLDGLLTDARNLALAECTAKNPDLKDKEAVAEMVGSGAVIFGNLSSHRMTDIEFDWKKVIALDGETGPYVQYSCVRCLSLLDKAKDKGEVPKLTEVPSDYEFAPEEEQLIVTLGKFSTVMLQVVRENEPFHITHYLIDVAKAFNRFYYKLPVLQAVNASQRQVRLNLVFSTRQVLLNGLELLGIRCPNAM